jgi:hypothetical protein
MEAGNRCYDDRVPEEVNRRVIDHSSDVLLPWLFLGEHATWQKALGACLVAGGAILMAR